MVVNVLPAVLSYSELSPNSESREAVPSFIDARNLTGLGSLPFHGPGVDE
jgi:hypothetical protein